MQPFHLVTLPNKEPVLKKGNPKSINIIQEIRQGRKTVTRIAGMEAFSLDIDELCKELTKLCASSATSKKIIIVIIQIYIRKKNKIIKCILFFHR